MTAKDRHASAATHHDQAARFHREASRHFEVGKDPAHWAHLALLAHGHTLQAVDSGTEARRHYARYEENTVLGYPQGVVRFPSNATEIAEAMGTILQGAQRHAVAADHHMEAARHHHEASKHCAAGNYTSASQEAELAHRHARKCVFHGHEAAKQHVKQYLTINSAAGLPRLHPIENAQT